MKVFGGYGDGDGGNGSFLKERTKELSDWWGVWVYCRRIWFSLDYSRYSACRHKDVRKLSIRINQGLTKFVCTTSKTFSWKFLGAMETGDAVLSWKKEPKNFRTDGVRVSCRRIWFSLNYFRYSACWRKAVRRPSIGINQNLTKIVCTTSKTFFRKFLGVRGFFSKTPRVLRLPRVVPSFPLHSI